jgi:hypothetical protein
MRTLCATAALAAALLIVPSGAGGADFIYQGKLVSIHIGKPPAPVVLTQSPPPIVQPPPGVPLEIAPPATPVPLPGATPFVRPITVEEFACSFRPHCGTYHVTFKHPYTGCAETVCFTLPDGCPKVEVKTCIRKRIEFDYGKKEVEIVFYRLGGAKVNY